MHENLKINLHQFVTIAAQFYNNLHKRIITCEAFVHELPIEYKFLIMAGTEEIKKFLLSLRFTKSDIKFLKTIPAIRQIINISNFDKFLEDFRFTGDFLSMAEGEVIFAGEPLIRVTGTLPEVHIVKDFILSVLNHDINIASKAARIILAARGKSVLDFITNNIHHESAINASRATYLAGFSATSNIEANRRFNIPLEGVIFNSLMDKQKDFEFFKNAYRNPILFIDTLDDAIAASKIPGLDGVILNSNISSKAVRIILDNNDRQSSKIILSGNLDEYSIDKLSKLPIDVYAIETGFTMPSLNIMYKNGVVLPNKTILPGKKQVFLNQVDGSHLLVIEGVKISGKLVPLLDVHIKDGILVSESVGLEIARRYCNAALLSLQPNLASLNLFPGALMPVFLHDSIGNNV